MNEVNQVRAKKVLFMILLLLVSFIYFIPFVGYTAESGFHSVTIKNTTTDIGTRENYFYMYFPNKFYGEKICPPGGSRLTTYSFNGIEKDVIFDYPIELHYDFTCRALSSSEHHDSATTLRFLVYDENGNAESYLGQTVTNSEGGRRVGSVTIPAKKAVRLEYFTGKWHFNVFPGIERLRAYTGTVILTYRTDVVRPEAPKGLRVDNAVSVPDKGNYTSENPVVVRWEEAIDQGNPASGIKGYTLESGNESRDSVTNNYTDTNNDIFFQDGMFNLQVKAWDYAGLESLYGFYEFYVDRTPPTGSININSGEPYTNNPSVTLNLQAFDAGGSGVKEMRLKNEGESYGSWEEYNSTKEWVLPTEEGSKKVFAQYRDYVGNISGEYSHEITLDTTPPTGTVKIVLDDSMKTRAGTKYIKRDGNINLELTAEDNLSGVKAMQFSTDGNTFSLARSFSEIDNWLLTKGAEDGTKELFVRLIDGAGNTSDQNGTIIKETIILDTTGPEGEVKINGGKAFTNSLQVILDLDADDGNGIGIDQMRFLNEGEDEYSTWEDFNEQKEWFLKSDAEDGVVTVYVMYKDALGNISTLENSITIDRKVPEGSFQITSRDGSRVFSQDKPANTIQVMINILQLTDAGSGIEGIYLWNGSHDNPPADAVYIESSQISMEQGIDWELANETGAQTVNMLIFDQAGNSSRYPYRLQLDITPPASPDQESFRHTQASDEHATISFFWEADNTRQNIEGFVGSYVIDGKESTFFDGQIMKIINDNMIQGQVELDVTTLGSNQPVLIKIRSLSKAGNESAERTYTAWTKAALGQITYLNGGYDETTATHYLCWHLTHSGEAAKHHLQYGQLINGVFNEQGEIEEDEDGVFKLSGLSSRQTGYYRLVALNGSNDKTVGSVFSTAVPNVAPLPPELLSPNGFGRNEVEFQFKEARDYDGDPITYELYFAEGVAPSDDSFQKVGMLTKDEINNGITLKKTNLIHNQTYTWYVIADDGNTGRTSSERTMFTVDTLSPDLDVEQPGVPYTNKRKLALVATDELSGIDKLIYKKIDRLSNQVTDEGVIDLTPDSNGIDRGTINLDEGYYHLQFTLYDNAGNQTTRNLNNLCVDYTPPQLLNAALELEMDAGIYIGYSSRIPLKFTAKDDLTLIKGLHYRFVTDFNQEDGVGGFISLSPELQNYQQFLEFNAYDGHNYYVAIWVEDNAGNRTEPEFLGPIFIDRTPPEVILTVEGLNYYGGQYYLKNMESLIVNAEASDGEGTVSEVQYALVSADDTGEVIGDWHQWAAVQKTPLESGGRYRIAARASNQVGLATTVFGQEFTYDNSPPEINQFIGPDEKLAGGEQGRFAIWAQDHESGITQYRLGIGTSPGAIDVSSEILGNQEGWLVSSLQQTPVFFTVDLPEMDNATYYATVIVQNSVGDEEKKTISFQVDNTIEKLIVTDQGPYTALIDRMIGSWRYVGKRSVAAYRYRILDQNNTPVTEWQQTTENEESCDGLELQPGETYCFEVQAIFAEGDYSPSRFSPGVMVDHTPPDLVELIVPKFTTSDQLWLQWAGVDLESSISQVQVAVGTDYMLTDVTKGWVKIAGEKGTLSCDSNGLPLKLLTNSKYYMTLRLSNGVGLTTEIVAQPITIDDTPPPIPVVYDQGGFINDQQPLEANWLWSLEDPESGTVQYQWAILEYGEPIDQANWQDGDESKKVILTDYTQQHGKTYYFAVKATNSAGLSSTGLSDGIIVDATVPYLPKIKLLNAVNLGDPSAQEVNYITSTEDLGLWIEGYDPDSGIAGYLYTWGGREELDVKERFQSDTGCVELEDPEIKDGEITIFAGESINNAGDCSPTGYSTGVLLDNETPKVLNVRGFYSGNKLYFDWDVLPSQSPVVKYEIALVPQGGAVEKWQEIRDGRSVVLNAEKIEDGYYRLLVRAFNAAGSVSRREDGIDEWGESPIIAIDRTPPNVIIFDYERYVSDGLSSSIMGEDNLSGIKCYQYAVGTAHNPFQFTGNWEEVMSEEGDYLEITFDTEDIAHNTNLYLMVRVCDQAGLWSTSYLSENIIVDHTPPEKPEIFCGDFTNSKQRISNIQFNGFDPESGITHYLLMVGTEEVEDLDEFESIPIEEFNGELAGLNLIEGKEYTLALGLRNAAGLWSEIAYSNPVTVDTTPPRIEFIEEGSEVVLNQPPLHIEFSLSEEAEVDFVLVFPDGEIEKDPRQLEAGDHFYTFLESEPGTYRLTAIVKDKAGNTGEEKTFSIRVNAPPTIILPSEIRTTPGQPVECSAVISDRDGEIIEYLWEPGDGGDEILASVFEYSYLAIGEYTLTLTVTDNDGATVSETVSVKVNNTTSGRLYTDETWSGEHRIVGDVLVPDGKTLTILPDTKVIIDGIPGVTGYDHALVIEGQLLITGDGPEVLFKLASDAQETWKGIAIFGTAELNNFRIEQAVRGITVLNDAQVNISNGHLLNNQVGLHVYGCRPLIDNTRFEGNTLYGIKEDFGGRPVVTDCHFSNNGIDYYHEELTALSMEQLNNVDGNSGNSQY